MVIFLDAGQLVSGEKINEYDYDNLIDVIDLCMTNKCNFANNNENANDNNQT